MANISKKSQKITPFGGIFHVMKKFDCYIGQVIDDMNNGFGWDRLPKSFMAENTGRLVLTAVFLLLTAVIRNFYKFLMERLDAKAFGLRKTSRIKAFVFKFISVPAKWIRTARHYVLNIYTDNCSYQNPFALADG